MVAVELAIFLALVGAAMGSFAGAIAWRLHSKRNFVNERSECEACHHKLAPLDLVPILSWLMLRGKCRYCSAPIGWATFVSEVGMAALFLLSYLYWPLGFATWQATAQFVLWLVFAVMLGILLMYDLRWMLLPDRLVFPLIALSVVYALLPIGTIHGSSVGAEALNAVYGIAALAGVYGLLYMISKGKWVGFGDVKLSIFIGIVLGWQKALLVLFLSNIIGFLLVVPGLISGKLTRTSRVPFGPFLIVAFFIAGLWGNSIIFWYLGLLGY